MKTINNSLDLRLRGWRKAAKSKATPKWLVPSIRKNIRRVERQLASRRKRAAGRRVK